MEGHSRIEMLEQKKTYKWRWCLVGNIIGEHRYGENGESKFGTKSFSTGTKVYIAPLQWGDGWERVIVIGKARHGHRYVEIIIASKYIKNFRLKKVFDPKILKKMDESDFLWWDDTDETKETITTVSSSLNARFKTWEDVDDVLFLGSEEEIRNIRCPECGGILRFKYYYDGRQYGTMRVLCESCHIMAVYCKIIHRPNCVIFFGKEATLIDDTFINIRKV